MITQVNDYMKYLKYEIDKGYYVQIRGVNIALPVRLTNGVITKQYYFNSMEDVKESFKIKEKLRKQLNRWDRRAA